MRLNETASGQIVALIDNMGDEKRVTVYRREEGDAKFSPHYVRATRLLAIQGVPGEKPRWGGKVSFGDTEVDGRVGVVEVPEWVLPLM